MFDLTLLDKLIDHTPSPEYTNANTLVEPYNKKIVSELGIDFYDTFSDLYQKSSMPKPITILPLASGWGPKSWLLFCFNRRPKFLTLNSRKPPAAVLPLPFLKMTGHGIVAQIGRAHV